MAARAALLTGLTLLALTGCGNPAPSDQPSPEQAITGFDPSNGALRSSFRALDLAAHDNPTELRQAALKHLSDSSPTIHYAAVYGLAVTVQPGQGSSQMAAMLSSTNIDERLLSAAALAGIGDKQGLPVLINALDEQTELSLRDPEQPAFDFARAVLLSLTEQDLGLRAAKDLDFPTVSATKPAWQTWWTTNQNLIHFDTRIEKYVS